MSDSGRGVGGKREREGMGIHTTILDIIEYLGCTTYLFDADHLGNARRKTSHPQFEGREGVAFL